MRSTARSECLDRLLILNQWHLERIFDVFVNHYNSHRPQHALALVPSAARRPAVVSVSPDSVRILRRNRLGGVVHEYVLAA